MTSQANKESQRVRLDVWLWAARFFKTRRLAVEAVKAGHVEVGGQVAKPSREVHLGDELTIRKDALQWVIVVDGLDDTRGPACRAQQLYHETPESIAERERQRELRRLGALTTPHPHNRPDKRDRRRLAGLKRS
jgi:ribosome-associated heat shock protein Hsp15